MTDFENQQPRFTHLTRFDDASKFRFICQYGGWDVWLSEEANRLEALRESNGGVYYGAGWDLPNFRQQIEWMHRLRQGLVEALLYAAQLCVDPSVSPNSK